MPASSTPPPPAEPAWPADWLEDVGACLWCNNAVCQPLISGVRDWYFGAVPGDFSYSRCRGCGSLVLARRPLAAHIGKAYRGYYTHGGEAAGVNKPGMVQRAGRILAEGYARQRYARSSRIVDAACAALFELFPVRRSEIDAVHRHLPHTPAQVLDFGCGNGDFLARAQTLGHHTVGVDFDPEAVQFAKTRGITVYEPGALPEADFAQRFDLVTAAHVVEHVNDPAALLRDFRRWLKPGGHLFIEVPNAEAAGLAQHGRFWRGLEAPRHFSLPSAAGLCHALGEAGFAPVIVGQRAFARHFMDGQSHAAALAHGGAAEPVNAAETLCGPEVLTCLARAR